MSKGLVLALGLDKFFADFTIKETKSDHIAFICTEANLHLVQELVNEHNLTSHRMFFVKNIFSTSETIKEFMNAFHWLKGEHVSSITIDATNCITVMEMATYVSASLLDVFQDILGEHVDFKLVYVHSDYKIREDGVASQVVGTEKLIELEKPRDSLSFVLAFDAARAFNKGRYGQAAEDFTVLERHASGDKSLLYGGLAHVAEGYESWDKMEHEQALLSLQKGIQALEKVAQLLPIQHLIPKLRGNMKALLELEHRDAKHMILDLYANAKRREKENRYDDAIARCYACLERMFQHQLLEKGIVTKDPDYTKLDKEVVEQFKEALKGLPHELALKQSSLLLSLLPDQVGAVIAELKYKTFVGLIGIRNNSILAHGTTPIGEKNFLDFTEKLLQPLFTAFLRSHHLMQEHVQMHEHATLEGFHQILYQTTTDVKIS